MDASIPVRAPSRLRRWVFAFFVGSLLAWLPFFLFDSLTYLIPISLRQELSSATALLGGFLALVVREREHLGPASLKILRRWAFLAPVGLGLLVVFQVWFIVGVPRPGGGGLASEIIAPLPRLETCPCKPAVSNQECLRERNSDPMFIARCWDSSRRTLNQTAWTLAYLMTIGGAASFVGLLWIRPGRARPAKADVIQLRESDGRSLFLSYSRVDREFAERLAEDLKASGITVWWDRWDVDVGDSLPGTIESALAQSTWFGIVLSPDSVASPWVRTELELALTLEIEGRVKVLPILYRPCEIPLSLRRKAWADFTSSPEEGLTSLLRSL